MQQGGERPAQRGLLVAQVGGGCLPTPRVLDFLCFDTPRSVLGDDGADEQLPFYLAEPGRLEQLVQQVRCAPSWVVVGAAAAAAAESHPPSSCLLADRAAFDRSISLPRFAGRCAMPSAVGGRGSTGSRRGRAAGALPPWW